jgi:formylglycine-generating enzyme required for sulfatase activity
MNTKVSIKEYFYFANDNESDFPDFWNNSKHNIRDNKNSKYHNICLDADCPIVGISHENIMKYITWLNLRTKKKYDLISEEQWHYLQNKKVNQKNIWYKANSKGTTHPVKSMPKNKKGIYGSIGNVYEIIQLKNKIGIIGLAWNSDIDDPKINYVNSMYKNNNVGFRLVENF